MSRKTWITIGAVVAVLLGLNILYFYYSPDQIVDWIGVENTYFAMFMIAVVGGANTLTSSVLYSSLVTFAAGGANPVWLGLTAGVGITIGDIFMYSLFRFGYQSVGEKVKEKTKKYTDKIKEFPRWAQYAFVYVYTGFGPLPNDLLMFALAVLHLKFRRFAPILLVGNITFATIAAYLSSSF